jgi:hypothetical protein
MWSGSLWCAVTCRSNGWPRRIHSWSKRFWANRWRQSEVAIVEFSMAMSWRACRHGTDHGRGSEVAEVEFSMAISWRAC